MAIYPYSLIPHIGLTILDKDGLARLLGKSNFSLARRIKGTPESAGIRELIGGQYVADSNSDYVKQIYQEIASLSMTATGIKANIIDAKFSQIDKGKEKWTGDELSHLKYKGMAVGPKESEFIVSYPANIFKEQIVKYPVRFASKDKAEAAKEFMDDKNKEQLPHFEKQTKFWMVGKIQLVHDPSNLNYWHFVLNITQFDGCQVKNVKIGDMQKENIGKRYLVNFALNTFLTKNLKINKDAVKTILEEDDFYKPELGEWECLRASTKMRQEFGNKILC